MTLLSAVEAVEDTPVDRWLAEQADLSAVERFSQHHARDVGPRQARYYQDLMPATAPGPGQQYGFTVDLDACTGCGACVAACHSLNGLDDGEDWRAVSRITGLRDERPFQQTITAACHHCVDPACLNGCPVDAYEKDPVTGIVKHLDDQCIGCGYCTLTCPYEVPSFNHRLGIVRKCDMCADRLAEGEAPACVQACPNEAISISVVDVAGVLAATRDTMLVPGAPPSAITAPTTTYRSANGSTNVSLARSSDDGPAPAHPPLAVMLVLTQLSVGAFATDLVLRWFTNRDAGSLPVFDAVVIAAVGLLALGASVFHLGRPQYAYRAVIGLRHSWLSREVVAFGVFTGLAVPYAAALWLGWLGSEQRDALGGAVALIGILGVGCSVLIYTTTHRSSWRPLPVSAKFAATAAVTGLATVIWATILSAVVHPTGDVHGAVANTRALLAVLSSVGGGKVLLEIAGVRRLHRDLRRIAAIRFACGGAAGVALPAALAVFANVATPSWPVAIAVTVVLAGVVAGELAERLLFFAAASRPR